MAFEKCNMMNLTSRSQRLQARRAGVSGVLPYRRRHLIASTVTFPFHSLIVRSTPESSRVDVAEPPTTINTQQELLTPTTSAAGSETQSLGKDPSVSTAAAVATSARNKKRSGRQADSTDAVATFLTRRFGIAGGLAWLGFLAVGTLGEQIKTRMEVANEVKGTKDVEDAPEVILPSGVRYKDLRIGGGQAPIKGYLVILDYVGTTGGVQFESTRSRGKPIVFLYGSRPYTGGMCAGLEQALSTMRAGGQRRVIVPPELGFGERGAVLRPTEHVPDKQGVVPPGATLEYDVELVRVSIPPS